jgi:hypothetical protein
LNHSIISVPEFNFALLGVVDKISLGNYFTTAQSRQARQEKSFYPIRPILFSLSKKCTRDLTTKLEYIMGTTKYAKYTKALVHGFK